MTMSTAFKHALRHPARICVERELGDRGIGSSAVTTTMVQKKYKQLLRADCYDRRVIRHLKI